MDENNRTDADGGKQSKTDRDDVVRWNLFLLAAGLLATLVPIYYYFALRGRLIERAPAYTETIPDPRVAQGQLTNLRPSEGGYTVSYLFPAQDLDGSVVYHGGQMLVMDESYAEMSMGDPLTIVYSGPRPRLSFIRDEVMAPPVQVFLSTTLVLILAAVNGVVLVAWGYRGMAGRTARSPGGRPKKAPPPEQEQPAEETSPAGRGIQRALLAGWASAFAFGEIMILAWLLNITGPSEVAMLLRMLALPGWLVLFPFDPASLTDVQRMLATSAVWFLIGVVIAVMTQSRWRAIAVWVGVAVLSVVIGIYWLIYNLSRSGP